ncbi:MAG: hypothetical protein MUF03_02195 [Rubrivivax sp.]|jgi:hypothetical protein|nr:hypothetical protein [Rubrivivax sp.]
MHSSAAEVQAVRRVDDLEPRLAAVEERLAGLGAALTRHDAAAIESEASALHEALASALDHFGRAARQGGVPPALRQRLAIAGARVAAQREALARAMVSLDLAIDALLPPPASALYSAGGHADRGTGSGAFTA